MGMAIQIAELASKLPCGLFFKVVGHHGWWDTIPMKEKGQGLMSLAFMLHWVSSHPSKGCGVDLSHFIALPTDSRGKHCVSEDRVHKARVMQHAVIG